MNNIELILPSTWLNEFKQLIRYPYNDIDANLLSYLNISITNIATQYLGLDENEASQWFPNVILQERVKLATFHLAATFYENPDILLTNSNGTLVDKNQIFRILGGLTKFYLAAKKPITEIPTDKNIWDAINKNTNDILINTNDIDTLRTDLGDLGNLVNENTNLINQRPTFKYFAGQIFVFDHTDHRDAFFDINNFTDTQAEKPQPTRCVILVNIPW